jgi:hypothetical protein
MSLAIPKPLSENISIEKIVLKINELRRALQKYSASTNKHTDLVDMPSSLVADHDGRYYTKTQIDSQNTYLSTRFPLATYTILLTDNILLCSGTFTLTLPTLTGNLGKKYYIKNIGTGVVTVAGNGTDKIDNESSLSFDQYVTLELSAGQTEWSVL